PVFNLLLIGGQVGVCISEYRGQDLIQMRVGFGQAIEQSGRVAGGLALAGKDIHQREGKFLRRDIRRLAAAGRKRLNQRMGIELLFQIGVSQQSTDGLRQHVTTAPGQGGNGLVDGAADEREKQVEKTESDRDL